jgi:hypothetical protein
MPQPSIDNVYVECNEDHSARMAAKVGDVFRGPQTGHIIRPSAAGSRPLSARYRPGQLTGRHSPHGLQSRGSIARPSRGRIQPRPFTSARSPAGRGIAVRCRPRNVG